MSTKFSFWTQYAINCLSDKDWKGAEGGLYNINSLLTSEYEVSVNTRDYQQSILETTSWECEYCHVKAPASKVRVHPMILPIMQSMVQGQSVQNVWFCTDCKKENIESRTNIFKEELPNPYYRKVVPNPPTQRFGLANRFNFEYDFRQWFYNFLKELQHQLALYRIEYVRDTGHDMADSGYVQKDDE